MKILPDTAAVSRQWAGRSQTFPHAMQAMQRAEGPDPDAIVRAVQCSDPSVNARYEALPEQARTLVHYLSDFVFDQYAHEFAMYLAGRWAPVGAANDPKKLNLNWPANFLDGLAEPIE